MEAYISKYEVIPTKDIDTSIQNKVNKVKQFIIKDLNIVPPDPKFLIPVRKGKPRKYNRYKPVYFEEKPRTKNVGALRLKGYFNKEDIIYICYERTMGVKKAAHIYLHEARHLYQARQNWSMYDEESEYDAQRYAEEALNWVTPGQKAQRKETSKEPYTLSGI